MKKLNYTFKKWVITWLALLFMFGSFGGHTWAESLNPLTDAEHSILESTWNESGQSQPSPNGSEQPLTRDPQQSIHIGLDEDLVEALHTFPEKPPYLLNEEGGFSGSAPSLQRLAAENSAPYSMAYLNTLSEEELVGLLREISFRDIPELFKFNPDTQTFYSNQDRVQALIDALEESGHQYTATDSKGIETLVEVLRSGFYLGYYNEPLNYLMDKTFLQRMFPALGAIADNPNFSMGTIEQDQVVRSFGNMIGNVSVNSEIIQKSTKILQQFNQNFNEYSQSASKGNAVYGVMSGIGYVLMWALDQTDKAAISGQIDDYLNEIAMIARVNQFDDGNAWVINNGLYYIGHLGSYHTNPQKGNQVLTEALDSLDYLGYQYLLSAQLINQIYKDTNFNGIKINYNSEIVPAAEGKYLPKYYEFDDGTMIMRTGAQVAEDKIKRLYWASKEVKSEFHRVFGSDEPVDPNQVDEILTMIIYNSPTEYKINSLLYGLSTDNGGLYMEGMGTFFTYERTPAQSIYTLEELFRHEFTHYLQGRFLVPGLWGQNPIYDNGRMPWFEEGGAELFAGSTRTQNILPRRSMIMNMKSDGPSGWMSAAETLYSDYGDFKFYRYAYVLQYHMYKNNRIMLDTLGEHIAQSDVNGTEGYDNYRKQLSEDSQLNTAYLQTLQQLVDDYDNNQLTTPLVADDYLYDHASKNYEEIFAEIAERAGLENARPEIRQSQFFKTFNLRGTYTGTGATDKINDRKEMNDKINQFLIEMNAESNSWNGYKTLTSYFTNHRVDENGNYVFDVVVHGFLPNAPSGENLPPVVAINGPYEGVAGQKILFSSAGSYAPSGLIVSYEWDFGDGTTGTGAAPAHAYLSEGTFTVKLKITDNNRLSKEEIATVTVKPLIGEIKPNYSFELATGPMPYDFIFPASFIPSDYHSSYFYFIVDDPTDVNIVVADPNGISLNWVAFHESDLNDFVSYAIKEGTNLSNTIKNAKGKYYLCVYRYNSDQNGHYSIKLSKSNSENPTIGSILIHGANSIAIPKSGTRTANYTAQVLDTNGNVMAGENVTWSLKAPVTGISVNADGTVTVDSDANSGTVTLIAASSTNAAIKAQKTITLNKEAVSDVSSIKISGASKAVIPSADNTALSYVATVLDKEGNDIAGEGVLWRLKDPVAGVNVDETAGIVTVDSSAIAGKFTLIAVSTSNSAILKEKDISLIKTITGEIKPNNTHELATGPLTSGIPVEATIEDGHVIAYFYFVIDSQTDVEFEVDLSDTNHSAWAATDETDTMFAWEGNNNAIDVIPGKYYIKVWTWEDFVPEDYSVKVTWHIPETPPIVTDISISGTNSVDIPETGNVTSNYTAIVWDEEDNEMAVENIVWSLKEPVMGVSVNEVTGTVTIDGTATVGTFTLRATSITNPNVEGQKTVTLNKKVVIPTVTSIAISGADSIDIPGSGSVTSSYTAIVWDEDDNEMAGEKVVWSLKEQVMGVSVDESTGMVIIDSGANGGTFTLIATSITNRDVHVQKTVTLIKTAIPVATNIVISGASSIDIPRTGSVISSYSARVYDEAGSEMTSEGVTWSLKAPVAGVAVNSMTGTVTVDSSAGAGGFTLIARSVSQPTVQMEKAIILKAASSGGDNGSGNGSGNGDGNGSGYVPTPGKKPDTGTKTDTKTGTEESVSQPLGKPKNPYDVGRGKTFDDIRNHWAQADIEFMVSQGFIAGTGEHVFAPDTTITRAELTALLVRVLGLKEDESSSPFSDVKTGQWHAGYVGAAVKAGLIRGYGDGTFRPDHPITREEIAVIMVKAMEYIGKGKNLSVSAEQLLAGFEDSEQISKWAKLAVAQSLDLGIIQGVSSNTLTPSDHATRAQAVVMIKRFINYMKD